MLGYGRRPQVCRRVDRFRRWLRELVGIDGLCLSLRLHVASGIRSGRGGHFGEELPHVCMSGGRAI